MVQSDRPQMTMWRMRFACWITKVADTHTHLEYVILLVFARQQWLRELASVFDFPLPACTFTLQYLELLFAPFHAEVGAPSVLYLEIKN